MKIIDILVNFTIFFYSHITCIDLYLKKIVAHISAKKRPLVETRGRIVNKTNSAYVSANLQLFFKVAYKPRPALKFRAFFVVPINIPGAKILAKFAKF